MSRAILILSSRAERDKAKHWIDGVPVNSRVEFKNPRRTLPQNDLMWALLTDVATQVPWHGIKLTPDDWKLVFLDALKREVRMVPNLDGNGFVNLGRSSSDLSKEEMSDLIELIFRFGAEHGVVFHDQSQSEPERRPAHPQSGSAHGRAVPLSARHKSPPPVSSSTGGGDGNGYAAMKGVR